MIPFVNIANAAGDAIGIVPKCALKTGGAENLECVMELFIRISDVLFGVLGSVMLLVFVYGGLLYLFSQGEPGKITKAFSAIKGGVIGLAIVFGAFVGVSFVVNSLRGKPGGQAVFSQYVTCGDYYIDTEGKPVDNSINEGQPCAPSGFVCIKGACVDRNAP